MRNNSHDNEHGTTSSYIIGFVLSLIFTFIPYYLVVNKVFHGNALIFLILVIAVVQMAIQLLFFLHLGRGPKPFYNVVFFYATAGTIVVVIGASIFIMANLYHNMSPEEVTKRMAQEEAISQIGGRDTGACKENRDSHIVTMVNNTMNPSVVFARLCDTITFVNKDDGDKMLGFGERGIPQSYGGLFEIFVRDDRPETVTLNQFGEFSIYDYNQPDFNGKLIVER